MEDLLFAKSQVSALSFILKIVYRIITRIAVTNDKDFVKLSRLSFKIYFAKWAEKMEKMKEHSTIVLESMKVQLAVHCNDHLNG